MVRGDELKGTELRELMNHPLLAPMLKNLVVVGDGDMGYPVHGGQALENAIDGEIEAIKAGGKIPDQSISRTICCRPLNGGMPGRRIVLRANASIQPFKQVFRE